VAKSTLEITGDAHAAERLNTIGERSRDQRDVMQREAEKTRRRIRGVPRDTGRLDKGVHGGDESVLEVTDEGYTIGTTVPYARFVFNGTRYMSAQPPRIPTDTASSAAHAVADDLTR
jgi:hypothetical protein